MKWLSLAKQGGKMIEEFNMLFRIHGTRAGLSFTDMIHAPPPTAGGNTITVPNPNQAMLKHFYQQAINPKIASQIILSGAPNTINGWMTKAAEVDSAFRRTNLLFSRGIQGGNGKRQAWKPKLSGGSRNHDQGEPMDVDAMNQQGSSKDREDWKKTADCYNCGKKGHISSECKAPPKQKGGGRPQQKSKGKHPHGQKKKFTPGGMRQHIRALIDENFEEGDDDYEEFVREVEEQGF
jgi:hypothetical protein